MYSDPTQLFGYDVNMAKKIWDKYFANETNYLPYGSGENEYAHFLTNSAEYAFKYAFNILDGEFPEGEDAIAKDAEYSYRYATEILLGRFKEGEPAIYKSKYYKKMYLVDMEEIGVEMYGDGL